MASRADVKQNLVRGGEGGPCSGVEAVDGVDGGVGDLQDFAGLDLGAGFNSPLLIALVGIEGLLDDAVGVFVVKVDAGDVTGDEVSGEGVDAGGGVHTVLVGAQERAAGGVFGECPAQSLVHIGITEDVLTRVEEKGEYCSAEGGEGGHE